MARTPEAAVLTQVHRQRQLTLVAGALADLVRLWRAVIDPTDFDSFRRFAELAARLLGVAHADAAQLAADYYRAFRSEEGIDPPATAGLLVAATAPALDEQAVADSLTAAALVGASNGRRAGQDHDQAAANALVRVTGTAGRLVQSGARTTLTRAIRSDEQALGWLRITDGDPCAFCRMIASQGPVYKSRRTASFRAHDHCACGPEPFFAGSTMPALNKRFADEWRAAQRWARETDNRATGAKNVDLATFRRYLNRNEGA